KLRFNSLPDTDCLTLTDRYRPTNSLRNHTMNYSPIFTIAARAESAYNAAQSFIANQCPVLEQRLKRGALTAAITVLEFAIACIDWLAEQVEKAPEYQLRAQLAWVKSKQWAVRQCIKVARFDERYQISATAAKAWAAKGQVARQAMDKVFALD
ncbi:MAG: hypothetical protein ACR2FS_05920, partial [Phormidesmis sp.]